MAARRGGQKRHPAGRSTGTEQWREALRSGQRTVWGRPLTGDCGDPGSVTSRERGRRGLQVPRNLARARMGKRVLCGVWRGQAREGGGSEHVEPEGQGRAQEAIRGR